MSAAGPTARARQEEVPLLGLGSGHRGALARTEGPGVGEKVQRWHVKNRTDTMLPTRPGREAGASPVSFPRVISMGAHAYPTGTKELTKGHTMFG